MKKSSRKYAQAFFEATKDKKDSQVIEAAKKFVKLLDLNNNLSRINEIISEFHLIWNKEHGVTEAIVISARELARGDLSLFEDYVVKLSGSKKVKLKTKIDKKILSGFILSFDDKIIDGSLKTKLVELKNQMAK